MAPSTSTGPLDEVVILSQADARELVRLLALLSRDQPTLAAEVAATLKELSAAEEGPSETTDRRQLVLKARTAYAERKKRTRFFNVTMFDEAAWDMLLALYITDFAGRRQTISKLVEWVEAPRTTANRWIDYLEKERLVERKADPDDRRYVFIVITERGKLLLDNYFSKVADQRRSPLERAARV